MKSIFNNLPRTFDDYYHAPVDQNGLAYDPSKVDSSKHSPYIGVTYDSHVDMYLGDLPVPTQYRHYLPGEKASSTVYTVADLDPRRCASVMNQIMDFIISSYENGKDGYEEYFQLEGSRKSRAMGDYFDTPTFEYEPLGRGVIDANERKQRQSVKRRSSRRNVPARIGGDRPDAGEVVFSQIRDYWNRRSDFHPKIMGSLSDNIIRIIAKEIRGVADDSNINKTIVKLFG